MKAANEDISTIRHLLQDIKKTSTRNWQKTLHSNNDAFITISKEVSRIEQDMGIMQEFLDTTNEICNDLLEQDDTTQYADTTETTMNRAVRRRTVRMSMYYEQNNTEQVNKLCNKIERARVSLPRL